MIRRAVASLLSLPIRWLDDAVPPELLRQALVEQYRRHASNAFLSVRAFADRARVRQCLLEAGLARDLPEPAPLACEARFADDDPAAWRAALRSGKALEQGVFARGAGAMLDALDEAGSEADRAFAGEWIVRLARHVELQREACLTRATPACVDDDLAIERHAVATLFARAARRRGDLRLLNAALKLNDWAWPAYARGGFDRFHAARVLAYLRALAEQEALMVEVLR